MSYQVLARKWRPRDFSTLVGQEHVVKALTHALEQKRLHHAWLFSGTRGVGKTTLSRILAKSLNCVGPQGDADITATPCGVCAPCVEIDAGRFVDYIEMDAASNRGVDEMAQLLEQAVYAPSVARFKIYMIDEVHMLTNHAFNAMLKTLEEPPAHVKFILATTDPQKIPVTVLSRCLQFNLKQMPLPHIVDYLSKVLAAEQIMFEPGALQMLAKGADGSMRDALSLTDQAIAYSAGMVSETAVRGMLGVLDQRYLIALLDALAQENGAALLGIADDMLLRSLSFSTALQDLAGLLHKVALAQCVPEAVSDTWAQADEIRRLAHVFAAQEVQLFYQIANHGRQDLALAPDPYAGFTMTLLRMLAFRPRALNEMGYDAQPRGTEQGGVAQHHAASSVLPVAVKQRVDRDVIALSPISFETTASLPERTLPTIAQPTTDTVVVRPTSRNKAREDAAGFDVAVKVDTDPRLDTTEVIASVLSSDQMQAVGLVESSVGGVKASVVGDTTVLAAPILSGEVLTPACWPDFAARLPLRGLAQQLAHQSELVKIEGTPGGAGGLIVYLRAPVQQIADAPPVRRLEKILAEQWQQSVKLVVTVGAVQATTAVMDAGVRAARQQAAEMVIAQNSFVQSLVHEFGVTIVPGSIRPTS
ncbi:MAG: DNA polymerase III subunit gamma/tau [Ottowia sp.]|nr:DNA polymerase III subunit gamma/tau [Ottowia sp.]